MVVVVEFEDRAGRSHGSHVAAVGGVAEVRLCARTVLLIRPVFAATGDTAAHHDVQNYRKSRI